jgi:hypothetical protein
MKKRLLEVEYKDIFSPETLATLKGKSAQSLKSFAGDKTLRQIMRDSSELISKIIIAESDYHIELAMIAEIMAREAYPILDYANIKIDAKIDPNNTTPPPQDEDEVSLENMNPDEQTKKRRIINGITQGASIRGSFGFLLFREHLDDLNPQLVENYREVLKSIWATYDNEEAIAMLLAMVANNSSISGGQSTMVYDEEEDRFVIKARAICFPILLHEIIKGLYEIVGTEGFGSDNEKNKEIIGKVDKLQNEPHDLQYGKFIYDGLSQLYNDSNISDDRVRELFFAEVYKLPDNEFFQFIENAIEEAFTPSQKRWALKTMKEIESDLKKDDTGLSDLDENKTPNYIVFKLTHKDTGNTIYSLSKNQKSPEGYFNMEVNRMKNILSRGGNLSKVHEFINKHINWDEWVGEIIEKNITDKEAADTVNKLRSSDNKSLNINTTGIKKDYNINKIYIPSSYLLPKALSNGKIYFKTKYLNEPQFKKLKINKSDFVRFRKDENEKYEEYVQVTNLKAIDAVGSKENYSIL